MKKPVVVRNATRRNHPLALMAVAFGAGMVISSFTATHVDAGEVLTALGTVAITRWLAGGPSV